MSSKITKRMMSSVDDMVSRASSATKRTGLVTTKRKAAKRALLEAPSKRRGGSGSVANSTALKSGRTVSKKGRKNGRGIGLLEQARLELRGKSQAARNVSLLSYVRGKEGTKTRTGKLTVSKSRRAVEKLLMLDDSRARSKALP